jgi:hypothetical protein
MGALMIMVALLTVMMLVGVLLLVDSGEPAP